MKLLYWGTFLWGRSTFCTQSLSSWKFSIICGTEINWIDFESLHSVCEQIIFIIGEKDYLSIYLCVKKKSLEVGGGGDSCFFVLTGVGLGGTMYNFCFYLSIQGCIISCEGWEYCFKVISSLLYSTFSVTFSPWTVFVFAVIRPSSPLYNRHCPEHNLTVHSELLFVFTRLWALWWAVGHRSVNSGPIMCVVNTYSVVCTFLWMCCHSWKMTEWAHFHHSCEDTVNLLFPEILWWCHPVNIRKWIDACFSGSWGAFEGVGVILLSFVFSCWSGVKRKCYLG